MAQRSGFDGVFLGSDGAPLVNISANILDGNNNQVTVYTNKTGAAEQAQPIITTSAAPGLVKFWAEPGFYQVELTDNVIPARFSPRKVPFNAVAGDKTSGAEGIDAHQIDVTNLQNRIATNMLQNKSVTDDKLSNDVVNDSNRAVGENHIKNNSISNAKIKSNSVNADNLDPYFVEDTTNSTTTYSGTGLASITGFSLSLDSGTWLIAAQLNFDCNNSIQSTAYFWNSSAATQIGGQAIFEGEGRENYSIPVSLIAFANISSGPNTVVVRFGSNAGNSVDITVQANTCRISAYKIG